MMAIISHDSKAKGCFYVLVSIPKKMCILNYHENKASWIIEDVDSEKSSLAIKIKAFYSEITCASKAMNIVAHVNTFFWHRLNL